jgi:hypothetical protein
VKYSLIFQNIKDNVNALTLNFWQTYIQCYELNKIVQQFDMFFIHTLNKFHIMSKSIEDIEFINSSCYRYLPINLIVSHLSIQINLCKNIMKMCSLTHQVPHLFSKQWTLITHHVYHLTNFQIIQTNWNCRFVFCNSYLKKMLIALCASNSTMFVFLVNGVDNIFKASTTYNNKIIIWIMCQTSKLEY